MGVFFPQLFLSDILARRFRVAASKTAFFVSYLLIMFSPRPRFPLLLFLPASFAEK